MDFQLFADKVCKRPWNFERVPNKNIEGHDKALIFTSTKEACLAACLNEVTFIFILHHPPPHPTFTATSTSQVKPLIRASSRL